ncbi:hypothetical protein JCM19000A_36760 [Silvimonas sp. JCM 19000]
MKHDRAWAWGRLCAALTAVYVLAGLAPTAEAVTLAPSERVTINLGETPWKYIKDQDPATAYQPGFDDSGWISVGVPYSADQLDTFINTESGGGEGFLSGNTQWYRKHFTLGSQYAQRKVLVELEGAHTGVQVYINGTFLPGNSQLNPQATHVVGFLPVVVDLTPYVKFDGSDNVLAIRVAKNANWFASPGFSQAFRFGQSDAGLFRPVYMYITDKVHIPQNVYAGLGTWGTYVATVSASSTSAQIEVQTNVVNEGTTAQQVTLTTQIVDANGNVVATAQDNKTVAANVAPGLHPQLFDQTLTVTNPTLWYPNNSPYGKPYMYKVFHTVSINGAVVDAVQSPLGIRTITWDKDFPLINGQRHFLWGGSGRYDYPALGTSVPEEQQWRDLQQMAAMGGNLWRPGHSSSSPEFVDAADALGVFIVQPSGDGENGFADACTAPPCNKQILKTELHREMIVRDRSHPSILAWEADNGATDTTFAQSLKTLSQVWDPINTRAQADRTPNPANGDILGCTNQGCEVLTKQTYPNKPAWGSEYWGNGSARGAWDFELAFAAPFLDSWRQGVAVNAFGMAQWYFADTPGESSIFAEGPALNIPQSNVRSLGASMVDQNRFPKLLYYIYKAAWTPYATKPVVALAHHWNRSGSVRVNAFSNCPKVRLLVNGTVQGADQTPNSWNSDSRSDLSQNTTKMPFQVHWDGVTWQSGTVTAQCLDSFGNVVATDSKTTAGPAAKIVLTVVPNLVKPDGTAFATTANGSDAAFVEARVTDANGVVVPTASNNITFAVSGPVTYMGGTQQYVTAGQALTYHSPGDHELQAEGGMTKVALRTQFTTGTVTVSASANGLTTGTTTFVVQPVTHTTPVQGAPVIIAQPVAQSVTLGQPAHFSVTATGAATLSFQWKKNGSNISGATGATYDTPATTSGDNGATYSVAITNSQGTVTSSAAALSVFAAAAPTLSAAPAAQSVDVGQSAHFSVTASGSPTLSYQWKKNGSAIQGATNPTYDTPILALSDDGALYSVTVTNPVNAVTSAQVRLTVNAARVPTIATQPTPVVAIPGQPATFTVVAAGSAPFHYQWMKDGAAIGGDSATFSIAAVQNSDAGSYSVTVTNLAGSVTSAAVTLKMAPPGVNLALNKVATASSYENQAGNPASNAVDGNATTKWGSAFVDPSWFEVDLGSVQTFNRVILRWEAAFASSYEIQVSNDNANWTKVYGQDAGAGGVEDFTFPTQKARYIRMYGKTRGTVYGYSLYEFEVYNGANCGNASERYTVIDPATVKDNVTGLTWKRQQYTLSDSGAQFTQPLATAYCANMGGGWRLPTKDEALAISGANASTCAFPAAWNTWTSTSYEQDSTYAYWVSSTGTSNIGVATNFPGWALCTQGTSIAGPAITTQPTSLTVAVGASAHFTVTASGATSYQWYKNGGLVATTTTGAYDTPATTTADNGATYKVVVLNAAGGSTTSSTVTLTVTSGGSSGTVNLALNRPASASSTENATVNPASAAFDGDAVNTRWSSTFVDPGWISVDLGSVQSVNHVILRWEAAYATAYQIQVSTDNTNWTTAYTQSAGVGGVEDLRFNAVSGRYVRMYGTARATQYGYSLFEFEVYGAASGPAITTQPAAKTAAVGQTATFSVVASGSGLTYQWLKNGAVINGATSASYTTPALAATDNGAAFTVIVTDSSGNKTTSNQALLTVTGGSGSGSTNLALGHTATASSNENPAFSDASYVADGNTTTRWSSLVVDPSWVTIDLGSTQSINKVVLIWETAYGKAYQIQVSTDNVNWTTAYTQANGAGGTETLTFNTVSGRYVRMYGTARGTQYGYSLWEFQVFGPASQTGAATSVSASKTSTSSSSSTAPASTATSSSTLGSGQSTAAATTADASVNLALNKVVKVSGSENAATLAGTNAVDGNSGTRWGSAFVDPGWIEVDLGSVQTVGRVVLRWEAAYGKAYQIQTSNDEANWSTVYTQTAGKGGVEDLSFASTTARYVRMYGTQRATQYGYSLWEFEVYSGSTGTSNPAYTVYPGFVGTELQNNTKGAWRDDQIYVTVLGRDPASGVFSWLKPDGTLTHAAVADNDANGHLIKNGVNYPNYAFTLAQSKLLKLPKMDSGRVFISLGEPVYLKVLSDVNGNIGYAGPNPLNPTDPNIAVNFDWYEFTYNTTGLWINTTQVDEFGVPLLLDVYGANQTFHAQTGITESVSALYNEYVSQTPAEFHTPTPALPRIMAPGKSTFDVGQANGNYFDSYVNQMWTYYTSNTLTVDMWGGSRRFSGRVQGNTLVFTEVNLGNGAYQGGTYNVSKPTTQDILEGKGTLATGNSVELALEAQICAAFNRHIMQDSSKWATPSAWYSAAPANFYAKFWHSHSVGGLAYGFAYDDVSDQSSTIMSPTPEHMVFGIGW